MSLLRGKYCLIHLEIVMRPKKCNYNVEILFKTRKYCPQTQHNIILFELDINVKFPLLSILQFLSVLKSAVIDKLGALVLELSKSVIILAILIQVYK